MYYFEKPAWLQIGTAVYDIVPISSVIASCRLSMNYVVLQTRIDSNKFHDALISKWNNLVTLRKSVHGKAPYMDHAINHFWSNRVHFVYERSVWMGWVSAVKCSIKVPLLHILYILLQIFSIISCSCLEFFNYFPSVSLAGWAGKWSYRNYSMSKDRIQRQKNLIRWDS